MAFDHARFFGRKNSTNLVLFFLPRVRVALLAGLSPGIVLVFASATLRDACADDGLYLVGNTTTYTVNGQENFLTAGVNCLNYRSSTLCVDGGATLKITGAGNTLLSQGQIYVGYSQSGTSSLVIADGGNMLLNYSIMQVGWSGGNGQISVSGAGSQIIETPDSLMLAGTGDNTNGLSPFYNTQQNTYGSISVTDGGHIYAGTVGAGIYHNGVGTITVDGQNSLLYVARDYHVNGGSGSDGGSGTTRISNGGQLVVNGQIYFGGDKTDGFGKLIVESGGILELGDTVSNAQTLSALRDEEGVGGQSDFVLSGGIVKLINSGLTTAMSVHLDGGVQSTVDTNAKTALLSGVLSGDGGLTKAGDGTLTLSGINTYTGATDILSGTLKLSGSGTIDPTAGVHNNGQLDIADVSAPSVAIRSMDGDGTVTLGNTTLNLTDGNTTFGNVYSGVIAGNGGLTVSGGTTILTGQNTYTGGTDVQAGTLQVDGGLLSQVSVRDGAVLAGQGVVGGASIYSGGSLLPGSAAAGGLLQVTGNLDMVSGSTLLANSLSSTHELVRVGGVATLSGGVVQIAGSQSLQEDEQYTVLSAANGVVGHYDAARFDQLGDYPFLTPTLSYTPNTVNLQFLRNTLPFSALAQTRNQLAAGYGLQSVAGASSVVRAVVQLGGVGAVHAALDALSGEIHASARTVLLQDAIYVRQAIADRLAGSLCGGGATGQGPRAVQVSRARIVEGENCTPDHAVLWGEAYGGYGSNGGDGNAASLHNSTAGFIMGVDRALGADGQWRAGGLVSYGRSMMQSGERSSSGRSNNVTLGGYGGTHWGRVNLHVGASYTWNMLALNRTVAFAGFGNTLSSHYNGGTAQVFGELGYRFHARGLQLEPFGSVAYVNQHTNSFHEQGGAAALRGQATDTGVTFATFGLRVSSAFWARGVWVSPHATVGYRHAFGLMTATTHESFVAGSGAYGMDVAGVPLSCDVATTEAGVSARLTDRVDIGLSYIGQYGGLFASSGAHGRVTFRF